MEQQSKPAKEVSTFVGSDNKWLDNFINIYQQLSINNLDTLHELYNQNITFEDPIHQISGLDNLLVYFQGLYQNIPQCDFVILNVIANDDQAAIYWQMSYIHPKLNKGSMIIVNGNSLIKGAGDKIIYHRDYFDVGQMIYQHIPLIGRIIRWIKAQL